MGVRRAGGRSICARTGKKRYDSYFEARQARDAIKHQTGEEHGKPYSCSSCDGWHLGGAERS